MLVLMRKWTLSEFTAAVPLLMFALLQLPSGKPTSAAPWASTPAHQTLELT